MGDVHFTCPACSQSLVAEDTGGGLTIDCPHCGKALQIPFAARDQTAARESRKLSKWIHRATELERELYDSETQLAETRRESEQRQIALAETFQQLRAAKEEWAGMQREIEEERAERETLLAQLRSAQTAGANALQRIADLETEHDRLSLRARRAEAELTQKQKQLEAAHAARNESLVDLAQKRATLGELSAELETLRGDRGDLENRVRRAQNEQTHEAELLADLRTEHEELTVKFSDTTEELSALKKAFATMRRDRDQLAADVQQDHELADFLAVKAARDRFENENREMQALFVETREKLHVSQAERDSLRREAVELQLKLSAVRDSASGQDLREDNELLRGIIERLNEELKERPAPRRRRRKKEPGQSRLAELFRALWTRVSISDPGTT